MQVDVDDGLSGSPAGRSTERASSPIVRVVGTASSGRTCRSRIHAGAASSAQRRRSAEVPRTRRRAACSRRSRAGARGCHGRVRVPAAAAEQRRGEPALAQPGALAQHPRARLLAACRAGVGRARPVRVVPERAARGRLAGALDPARRRPRRPPRRAAGAARRRRKPPGRRSCRRAKASHTASSSGRSTWQETTAYRSPDVPITPRHIPRAAA